LRKKLQPLGTLRLLPCKFALGPEVHRLGKSSFTITATTIEKGSDHSGKDFCCGFIQMVWFGSAARILKDPKENSKIENSINSVGAYSYPTDA
jgi:hypothetical protein